MSGGASSFCGYMHEGKWKTYNGFSSGRNDNESAVILYKYISGGYTGSGSGYCIFGNISYGGGDNEAASGILLSDSI